MKGAPMTDSLFLHPGTWLMRRFRLPGKLLLLGAVMVAMFVGVASMAGPQTGAGLQWAVVGICVATLVYLLAALYASLSSDLAALATAMEKTAQGDLGVQVKTSGHDELADLALRLDRMVQTLSAMVADIRSNAALVAHAGQSISMDSRALADRTEQQAASPEETAASVEQLSSTVQSNGHL